MIIMVREWVDLINMKTVYFFDCFGKKKMKKEAGHTSLKKFIIQMFVFILTGKSVTTFIHVNEP